MAPTATGSSKCGSIPAPLPTRADTGLLHELVTVRLGRLDGWWGHDGLVFDRGQSSESGLPASAVISPFDPPNDRGPQLLSGGPGTAVEHVLLQQREERLHGGVVAGGADAAHRADHGVSVKRTDELPAAELGPAVGVKHAAGDVAASGDRVVQGLDGESRLHPRID